VEQRAEPRVSLLRNCRKRIASEQESLGPYTRIPLRVGKPVTFSRLLSRLADAMMLDSDERAELFRLVRPEL
jgi:hypothetical protein